MSLSRAAELLSCLQPLTEDGPRWNADLTDAERRVIGQAARRLAAQIGQQLTRLAEGDDIAGQLELLAHQVLQLRDASLTAPAAPGRRKGSRRRSVVIVDDPAAAGLIRREGPAQWDVRFAGSSERRDA